MISEVEISPVAPNYVDVTDLFRNEAQKIRPAELVMLDSFELVNSINALEIMDAKMDTGLLDLVSEDWKFDTVCGRSANQVIAIMDTLFAMEMSWHTGGALSQTVLTCLYTEQALTNYTGTFQSAHFGPRSTDIPVPQDDAQAVLVHKILRPFVLATAKTCDLSLRKLVCNEIMEDEDIVTQTYGLDLLQFVTGEEICGALADALHDLDKLSLDAKCRDALSARLNFRITALKFFDPADDVEVQSSFLQDAVSVLDIILKTHVLAEPVPDAFSIAIQGRLECGMPPRPKVELKFEDAMKVGASLALGLLDILKIHTRKSIGDIVVYFEHFAIRRPSELPYIRSQLFKQYKKTNITPRDVIVADINDICSPPPSLLSMEKQNPAKKYLDGFLAKAERCLEMYLSILCRNRCRLRQDLCRVLLDWDSLQVDSENLESSLEPINGSDLRALPLSSWVYFRKLQIMLWIVYLGFDLEIYKLDEWQVMLWYADYLLGVLDAHLLRILAVLDASQEKNKKKKKSKSRTRLWISSWRARAGVYKAVSHAYMCLLAALSLAGCVPDFTEQSSTKFSSAELRYNLRMKPFSTIGVPELPTYATYKQLSDLHDWQVDTLLDSAQTSISNARKLIDALNQIEPVNMNLVTDSAPLLQQGLLRSCIGTSVAISVLKRMRLQNSSKEGNKRRVKIVVQRDKFHPFFPVLSISESK